MPDDGLTRSQRERAREVYTGRRVSSLTEDELVRARECGYEPHGGESDWLIGRDPRHMSQDELRAMQHEPMSPMEVIRAKCLDCCAGSATEVRYCVAMACPSWPFRTGKNPWRSPPSEAKRERGRILGAKMREKSRGSLSGNGNLDEERSDEVE